MKPDMKLNYVRQMENRDLPSKPKVNAVQGVQKIWKDEVQRKKGGRKDIQ